MATSSIFRDFEVNDPNAVKRFAKAIEESEKNLPELEKRLKATAAKTKVLSDPKEIAEFVQKQKEKYIGNK